MYRLGPKLCHVQATEVDALLRQCGYTARAYRSQADRTDYYGPGSRTQVVAWVKGDRARYHLNDTDNFPLNLNDYQFDRHEEYFTKEELSAIFTALKEFAISRQIDTRHVATALRLYVSTRVHPDDFDFGALLDITAYATIKDEFITAMLSKGYTLAEIKTYSRFNPGLLQDLLGRGTNAGQNSFNSVQTPN